MMFAKYRENKPANSGGLRDRLADYYRKCEDSVPQDVASSQSDSQQNSELRKDHANRNRRARIARQYGRHSQLPAAVKPVKDTVEERGLRKFDLTDDYNLRHAAIDRLLDRGIPCRSLPTNRNDHRWRYIANTCGFSGRQIQLLQELVQHQSRGQSLPELDDEDDQARGVVFEETGGDFMYDFSSGFGYSSDFGAGFGDWRSLSEDPQHSREQAAMHSFATLPTEKRGSFDRDDDDEHRRLPCEVAQWALPQSEPVSVSVSVSEPASPSAAPADRAERAAAAPSLLALSRWAMSSW